MVYPYISCFYFGTDQELRIRVLQEGHWMNTEEGVV
jgi:hypothetical protein